MGMRRSTNDLRYKMYSGMDSQIDMLIPGISQDGHILLANALERNYRHPEHEEVFKNVISATLELNRAIFACATKVYFQLSQSFNIELSKGLQSIKMEYHYRFGQNTMKLSCRIRGSSSVEVFVMATKVAPKSYVIFG